MSASQAPFTIEVASGTDIWRKPPTTNVFSVPLSHSQSGPLKKFKSAKVTFWADWTIKYDQGGLALVLKRNPAEPNSQVKWVKTGIEYYMEKPRLSTVACDRWADWSISPDTTGIDPAKGVTLEIVREADELGKSAWVYQLVVDDSGKVIEKIPLREICWFFADEDNAGEDWTLEISPLVCRPSTETADALKVTFTRFEVEWL